MQRCHVVDGIAGSQKATTSGGKKPSTHPAATTVVSVARLRIPMQLSESYPISRTALNKAFEMDNKFKVTDDGDDDDDDDVLCCEVLFMPLSSLNKPLILTCPFPT